MTTKKIKTYKPLLGGAIGNVIEWYDFALFGFAAPITAKLFFPAGDPLLAIIQVYALFAIGFLSRPFGSVIFGYIGDHYGREKTLKLTIWFISIPTVLIGCMPAFSSIGYWAPVLIALLRFLQGFAIGGELTGSIIYLSEHAPPHRQGLYASLTHFSTISGILLGSAAIALTHGLLPEPDIITWGWRIPFLLALPLALTAFYLRYQLPPSITPKTDHNPLKQIFIHDRIPMLQTFLMNIFVAVYFYILFVFNVVYFSKFVGTSTQFAYDLITYSLLLLIVTIPLSGWLSDKYGRKPVLTSGTLAIMLLIIPCFKLFSPQHLWLNFLLMSLLTISFGMVQGTIGVTLANLFPAATRASGLSISFNLSNAIFGGTTPMIIAWLLRTTNNPHFITAYILLCGLIFLATLMSVRTLKWRQHGYSN